MLHCEHITWFIWKEEEDKKGLEPEAKFYCIPPHKGRALALLDSLFIEGEASPYLFHLLQLDVQPVEKNYQRKSTKSFHEKF